MLGIAARSSIAAPMGPFKKLGAISVRKMAMPIATGMAKRSERVVVTRVPRMFVKAPNTSFTGSQLVDVRNLMIPNRLIAREDSDRRIYKIPRMKRMTVKEAMPVTKEKKKSMMSFFAVFAAMAPFQIVSRNNILRILTAHKKQRGRPVAQPDPFLPLTPKNKNTYCAPLAFQ